MNLSNKVSREQIIELVEIELDRANNKFPPFNSTWEGFGVIFEEFDELKDEVRAQKKGGYVGTPLISECVQVAAMAIKMLESLPWHSEKELLNNVKQ